MHLMVYGYDRQPPSWLTWPEAGVLTCLQDVAQVLLELQDARPCACCSSGCPVHQLMGHGGYWGKAKEEAIQLRVSAAGTDCAWPVLCAAASPK